MNTNFSKLDEIIQSQQAPESPRLRFLALENLESREWTFYDSETHAFASAAFGSVVCAFYNSLLASGSESSPHHEMQHDAFIRSGWTEGGFLDFSKFSSEAVKDFEHLVLTFKNWGAVKSGLAKNRNETLLDLFSLWKTYRFASFWGAWSADYDESRDSEMYKIFRKQFCIPIDSVYWTDGSGTAHVSKGYVLNDAVHIFAEDLYKTLLSGQVAAPVVCRRCGELFYSNNVNATYCSDCQYGKKERYNELRRQNKPRYLHKRILDYCQYHGIASEKFRKDSNSFWAEVKSGAKTEDEYISILEKTFAEMKGVATK